MQINEGQRLSFVFGFDPNTNEAKMNIYDGASARYLGSIYFDPLEEVLIQRWASNMRGVSHGTEKDQEATRSQ